jgi:SpoVK/Ycf46/Vps4 family AAA+-type ATPase
VYAAERPRVKIEEVSGGGYDRVREFLASITRDAALESLFAATHPTRSGERAHALLIGPPGCGKTEALRAIGGLTDSIGISVKGSDFQTCWMGEAMKNPGRLFGKAVELHHKTGKRVHLLIDEIDQVLMEPETEQRSSGTNLVYEFLQLLDGVVDYPGVTLWGATNHPDRLSTRVMRRFPFVEIVGELTVKDRAELLRRFCEALPVESDLYTWEKAAALIDGAVGDAVRKVAESLWRERMGAFVRRDREAAEKIAKTLVNEKGETTHHGDMSREARRALAASLREHFSISEAELLEHVRTVALSPSVRQEIDQAVETYASARRYLDLMRAV